MSIERVAQYVDIGSKVITSIAILLGGGWAFWTFVITRAGMWNLQLDITSTDVPYDACRLLTITVKLRNIGKVMIEPAQERGCTIEIRRLERSLALGEAFKWESAVAVLEETDIISHYEGNYYIEPGAEYREYLSCPVPEGSLLMTKTVFRGSDSTPITDYSVVQTRRNRTIKSP
jgi:hypothetical protein